MTVLGRAGQEKLEGTGAVEGQLGTQDEVKASFRSPDCPDQAGEAPEAGRARGSGQHGQSCGPGVQDAASGCTQHAPSGRRGPTWVPAVLPEHVGLHAVLGGEEPVAAGHRTPALRGSHVLQVLLGVDVEAAPRREPGTAPWGERTAA